MKKLLLTLLLLFTLGLAAKATDVTFDFVTKDYGMTRLSGSTSEYNENPTTITDGAVTIKLIGDKGTRLWDDGVRFYKGSSMEISATDAKIKSVKLLKAVDGNAVTSNFGLPDGDTNKFANGVWTGDAEIATINCTIAKKNVAVGAIVVTYESASGPKYFTFEGFTNRTENLNEMIELNLPADAPTITYSSTNRDVAYIEDNVIYAVGVGSADITARWDESEAWKAGNTTFTITVENPNLKDADLSFDKTAYDAEVGVQFSAAKLLNPNNLTVAYSSGNPETATVDAATGVVTPLAAGTVEITAKSEPTDEYKAGVASYTLNIVKVNRAKSLADFITMGKELGNKAEIIIDFDMTVTYANLANTYVTDGKTFGLIYKAKASTNLAEVGQILKAGWKGTLTVFQGVLPEIIPVSDPTIDGTAEFTPQTYTLADITDEMVNEVVLIKGVEFATATPGANATGAALNFTGTQNGTEGAFYNKFKIASVGAGTYDVIAVVNLFNLTGKVLQIYPIEYIKKIATSVSFDQESVILAEGTTATQLPTVTPEGVSVTYSSSDETVATVDAETGEVTAVAAGTATITATVGNNQYATSTANYTVTVVAEGDVNKLDGEISWGPKVTRSVHGWLSVRYEFNLKNYKDAVVEFTLVVKGANGNPLGVTVENIPTSSQNRVAAETFIGLKETENISGKLVARGEALGTVEHPSTQDMTVEVNATVDGKKVQENDEVLDSPLINATGIEDVTVEGEGEAEYFNLQGLRVAQPEAGQLYIKRQGGKAVKVRF